MTNSMMPCYNTHLFQRSTNAQKKAEAGEATSLIQSDAPETFSEPWGKSAKGVDDLLMFVFLTSPVVTGTQPKSPTFSC